MNGPPLPQEYQQCDVFYTDPPWLAGFDTFNRRAEIHDQRTYRQFTEKLGAIIEATYSPMYIVAGRNAEKQLPPASKEGLLSLNGQPAVVYLYRTDIMPNVMDAVGLLQWLAQTYSCVGDFCCGYGRTGKMFTLARKRFVMSDYNPSCIGYIAQQWEQA